MNFLHLQRFHLTTLAPVHLGSGRVADPGTCLVRDGEVHFFDPSRVLASLSPEASARLAERLLGDDFMDELRKEFDHHARALIASSYGQAEAPAALESEFHTAGQKNSNQAINMLAIVLAARAGDTGPLLVPGSALKGALRTALIASGLPASPTLAREAPELARLLGEYAQTVAAGGKPAKGPVIREAQRAAERIGSRALAGVDSLHGKHMALDPLRFLKVADSTAIPATAAQVGVSYVADVARTSADTLRSQGARRFETLHAFQVGVTEIEISCPVPPAAAVTAPADRLPNLARIGRAAAGFYLHRLWADIALAQRVDTARAWALQVESFLRAGARQRIESGEWILLRVGLHSGANSLTFDGLRAVERRGAKERATFDTGDGASRVRMAASDPKGMRPHAPFGWVLLTPEPLDAALAAPLTEAYRSTHAGALRAAAARAARALQAREQAEREQAEAEAEARRAAALATLSDNLRRAEELAIRFDAHRRPQKPGTADFEAAFRLLREAVEAPWSSADQTALAALAAARLAPRLELGGREKEFKRLLRTLRGET